MDMSMFHANLSNLDDTKHRELAYMIMNDKLFPSELSNDDKAKIKSDKEYFNNVSAKAVANGDLLRSSIGNVNEAMKNEEKAKISKEDISEAEKQKKYAETDKKYSEIYKAFSQSVAEVVKGEYYKTEEDIHNNGLPDSTKKIGEKDGFGSKPVPDAFDIIYDQACEKHGLADKLGKDKVQEYKNRVDSKATEVGRAKTRIIMRYLNALSGNPTLYSGDELGMTGYEDKCKNTYLQNRNALDWSIVEGPDKRQDIVDYKNSLEDISRERTDDIMNPLEALNNGTMHKLDKQEAYDHDGKQMGVSAVMSQASNGAMSISLFNPNGISTDNKINLDNLHPTTVWLNSIYLKGPKGKISLNPETKFMNANPKDKAIYEVKNNGDDYYIKRIVDNKEDSILMDETTAPDGVMMLYHIPDDIKKERTDLIKRQTGNREYYNQRYNIPVDSAYTKANKPDEKTGENIDVTSKE